LNSIIKFWKLLGPGLLYAGAAVGVSHLVQATKAGAVYGFALLGWVVLINVIKYPFFEVGPRYFAATGNSLVQGYAKLGKWAVGLFIMQTLSSMWIIQSAVVLVTAGLAKKVLGLDIEMFNLSLILFGLAIILLISGKYSLLSGFMKWMMIVLAISTVIALFFTITQVDFSITQWFPIVDLTNPLHLTFLVGLLGWMPAPLEVSVWHSVWSKLASDEEEQKYEIKEIDFTEKALHLDKIQKVKNSMLDFHIGYWGTMILAMIFLALGALVIFPSQIEISKSAVGFASQLISMYQVSMGSVLAWVVSVAALVTMISTTIGCLDAFPRVLEASVEALADKELSLKKRNLIYRVVLFVVALGALVILNQFLGNLKSLIQFATAVAFITTPLIAILNYKVINSNDVPDEFKFSKVSYITSWVGMISLLSFALYYVYNLFV
jgi:Mn2+/Fe2+ NRAMP family transporter